MSKELLKQALEALEIEQAIYRGDREDGTPEHILEAITAIKEYMAQPEPIETYIHEFTKLPHPGDFGIPKGHWWHAKQYADQLRASLPPQHDTIQRLSALVRAQQITIDKLEAQPEQEPFQPDWANFEEGRKVGRAEALEDGQKPVGKWIGKKVEWTDNPYKFSQGQPIYTSPPPQSTWVGLTESDRRLINFQWQDGNGTATEIIDLVEAKLKEKNT